MNYTDIVKIQGFVHNIKQRGHLIKVTVFLYDDDCIKRQGETTFLTT